MSRKLVVIAFLLVVLLSVGVAVQLGIIAESYERVGFSGYVTSQSELENTVGIMEKQDVSIYRLSFKPSWLTDEGNPKGYNRIYINYLLENTNFFIVVDGNHLYPHTEESAVDAREHWLEVENRIFETLDQYPNNSRVAVELINEYASADYNQRIQSLIDKVRAEGYTNPLVTNKLNTPWHKFSDPLDNTYQGMHFYFNSWDTDGVMRQMAEALADNITKIMNTEVGANFNEYRAFTQSNVDELEAFVAQSQALGITNCIWMNNNADNWQGYTIYGFMGTTVLDVSFSAAQPTAPSTFSDTPTVTPSTTLTPKPSPTPSPQPTPTMDRKY